MPQLNISPRACRDHARGFDRPRFQKEFRQFVDDKWGEFQAGGRAKR